MAMSEYCVAGGGGGGEFIVTVNKVKLVAAALAMHDHWLPLSNLDLLLPAVDVGVFFCYKNPTTTTTTTTSRGGGSGFASMVATLKKGLAQALVSYYALAGEVVSLSYFATTMGLSLWKHLPALCFNNSTCTIQMKPLKESLCPTRSMASLQYKSVDLFL
ncbi:Shikimate O-hydroxycinnamoyltransferase [Quillaja saponaria]|uniref:Shikimate O-hydroxycinnamoyltransferase n=1 Tax=Quillaja saponaria TaxID=32244 RepID=A0AAD7LBC0_QUISA|nr:Shikimate O-hydroxycinnamoyltransferase [Quillaja saponaria]